MSFGTDIRLSSNAVNQALGHSKAVVKDFAEAGGFDNDEAGNPLDVPYRPIRIWSIGTAVRSGGSEGPGTTRPPEFPAQFDGRLHSNNEYRRSEVAARRQLHQRPLGSTRRLDPSEGDGS